MPLSFLRKSATLTCAALLGAGPQLRAQSQVYNLQELVGAASAYRPSVQAEAAGVKSAHAGVANARHQALPLLKLHDQVTLSTANSATGTFFPLGTIVPTAGAIRSDNVFDVASGNIAILYTEYELANFGLRKARVDNAKAFEKLSSAKFSRTEYLTALEVSRNYFQLIKAWHRLAIESENVRRYDTLFTLIRAQTSSGLRPGADSAQVEAELSRARGAYNIQYSQVQQLKQSLSAITGIGTDSLQVDTSFLGLAGPVLSGLSAMDNVLPDNPLLNYYDSQHELLLAKRKLIRKSYLPKLLFVGGGWARGSSISYDDRYLPLEQGLNYTRFNYGAGLALSYNIPDMVHRHDELVMSKYDMQKDDYERQEEALQLSTALQKADAALEAINKNTQEGAVQLASTTALYQQKLAQYQAGVSNLVDLTNAAFLLYRVQVFNIDIVIDKFLAGLDKAAARGNLTQFIQSIKQ